MTLPTISLAVLAQLYAADGGASVDTFEVDAGADVSSSTFEDAGEAPAFEGDHRLVPVVPPPPAPTVPDAGNLADDQRRVAIAPTMPPEEPSWARFFLEFGFVAAPPLVGGTPLNANATELDPTPDGVSSATGGAARVLFSPRAISELRAGLGLELVSRPLNAGAVSAQVAWCTESDADSEGKFVLCAPLELRFNLPRRGVGPFTDGPFSARIYTRGEYDLGGVIPHLGLGFTFERYLRNDTTHLDALVFFATAGFGLEL